MLTYLKQNAKIIRHDKRPMRCLLAGLIHRLPFDVGRLFHITIRVQDYLIHLRVGSMSVALWYDPNDRASDYMFLTGYLKEGDVYLDVGANIGTTLIPAAKSVKDGKAIGF